MMTGAFTNALKGIGGEYEINRLLGAIGCVAYIVGAHAFVAWNLALGREFDLTAYCLAFPSGLGVAVGSIAGAVALKDRSVAAAKATEAKTKSDSAGAIEEAQHEAAEQVAEAAADEKDKITGAKS